jgi:branched-chain amino acid transport system permease protein
MPELFQSKSGPFSKQSDARLSVFGFSPGQGVALLVLVVFIFLAPFFFYELFLVKVFAFAIFAIGYNLLLGYTGIMSFGHAAFFGLGAYTSGLLASRLGLSTELSLLAGIGMGAATGAVFGLLAIRRRGIYLAMITLALAQMVFFVCLQSPLTGGEDGVQGIPRGVLLGVFDLSSNDAFYFFSATILVLTVVVVHRIIHSPFGRVLRAVRDNDKRVESLGFDVMRYRLLSFVLSAGLAGLAGSIKAMGLGIATLTDVSISTTTEVVLIVLVGGTATVFGPIVGALGVLALEHFLTPFGPWFAIVQGTCFVAFVLLFRNGIVGSLQRRIRIEL